MEPPVKLDELMARIRAVVDARRFGNGVSAEGSSCPIKPLVPEVVPAPPAPSAMSCGWGGNAGLEATLAEAASMLARARKKTEVGAAVPRVLRSLYRNQGGFNGILLEMSGRVLEMNERLLQQNVQFQARIEALEGTVAQQHAWTVAAAQMHEQQREWMLAMESYLAEIAETPAELERRLRRRNALARARANHPQQTDQVEDFSEEWLAILKKQVDTVDSHANRLGDHLKNLQVQVDEQGERQSGWHEQFRRASAHEELRDENARRLEERQHNDASFVKNQLWYLQRLIQPLLGTSKPAAGPHGDAAKEPPALLPGAHDLDALYLAFEDVMRGSRSEIKERVGVYLPYLATANAGATERPVLDLGCGRGEWLEVLQEHGLVASGVDLNTCMVERCRDRGLSVTFANALDHLQSLPDASCGAVTAFHLIEHLPFPVLVGFLRECRRVLQPGGIAIFETPNPYNVLVGSGYFYHDFTHQRPLPPASTKFLVEQLGFARAEILPLHPWDEAAKVHGDGSKALEWRFNELFYGPQDYALIATP